MFVIENVSKQYGPEYALHHVSMTIGKGMNFLVGASGSEKTTLLKLLSGMEGDFEGEISYQGKSIRDISPQEKSGLYHSVFGFVWQDFHLLEEATVLENVLLPGHLQEGVDKTQGERLLRQLNIEDLAGQKVKYLSEGQKQRVAIARALINDPSLLLADEPTGALDRTNASEIMELLKELSQDRLVIVITHDPKCAAYGDQIVTIQEGRMVSQPQMEPEEEPRQLTAKNSGKVPVFHWVLKNFRVRLRRYLAVSAAIALGVLCFTLSLSSGNIIQQEIAQFEEKNTAFHNGSLKAQGQEEELLALLQSDDRLQYVYPQYVLEDVSVEVQGHKVYMEEKYPMAKAEETLSYGVMPRRGGREIALSPSLAAKFAKDIQSLIGGTAQVSCRGRTYVLTISGIFNASYDDFYVSSDVEQDLYTGMSGPAYAVSYDVVRFEDIEAVSDSLKEQGLEPQDAAAQAAAFLDTFHNLQRLFFTISLLILGVAVLISAILLIKQQNTRMREVGLLSALGYRPREVRRLLLEEGLLLCAVTATFGGVLSDLSLFLGDLAGISLSLSFWQALGAITLSALVTLGLHVGASFRLVCTEPAIALRT